MPAKNTSSYIQEAIDGVLYQTIDTWELIIIDDGSEDGTYEIAQAACQKNSRIKVFKNVGKGKVVGLNYGFSKCSGDLIKCIDSDDTLNNIFIEKCLENQFDAMYHDAFVTNSEMKKTDQLNFGNSFKERKYQDSLENLNSLPRWTWTVDDVIARKIFPIPEELPYEDLWFSLMIKKHSKDILYVNKKLYSYRQHDSQTFKGIFNFNNDAVIFRSERRLKYVEFIISNYEMFWPTKAELISLLADMKTYLQLATQKKPSFKSILFSEMNLKNKFKILFIKKFPLLASYIKSTKHR